jgi:hypothetical protein
VLASIIVLNLHHRAPSKRRVPKWIRKYIIGKLGPYLGFLNEAKAFDKNKLIVENLHLKDKNKTFLVQIDRNEFHRVKQNVNFNCDFLMNQLQNSFDPSKIKSERKRNLIIQEIVKCQQTLLENSKKCDSRRVSNSDYMENEVKLTKIYKEWKILSNVIERICFFIYFFCFLTSSFWFFYGAFR